MSAQTLCKHPGYRQCYLELLQSQGGSRKCENLGLLASHLREEGPAYRAPMATEKGPPCSSLEAELISLLDLCLPVHILLAFSASSAAISSQLLCLLFVLQPTASTFLSTALLNFIMNLHITQLNGSLPPLSYLNSVHQHLL